MIIYDNIALFHINVMEPIVREQYNDQVPESFRPFVSRQRGAASNIRSDGFTYYI